MAGLYEGFEVGRGVVCGLEKGGLERSHGSQHSCRRLDVLSAEHVEGGPQTGTNGGEQGFGNEAVLGAVTPRPRARVSLLALASSLLMVLGVVGLFSIGLPLIAAAGFALGGAVIASRSVV